MISYVSSWCCNAKLMVKNRKNKFKENKRKTFYKPILKLFQSLLQTFPMQPKLLFLTWFSWAPQPHTAPLASTRPSHLALVTYALVTLRLLPLSG